MPEVLWTRRPRASIARLAVMGCGPLALTLVFVIVVVRMPGWRDYLFWPFLIAWVLGVFGFGVCLPWGVSHEQARRSAPIRDRRRVRWTMLGGTWAANAAMVFGTWLIFRLIL